MNLRKKIKSDAKAIIKKSWTMLIMVVFIVLAIVLTLSLLYILTTVASNINPYIDLSADYFYSLALPDISLPSILVLAVALLLDFIVLTPLLYGICLWFYSITKDLTCDISDVFLYFASPKMFFKSLFSRLLIKLMRLGYFILMFLPAAIMRIIKNSMIVFNIKSSALLLFTDILFYGFAFLGAVFFFITILKYALVPFIMAEHKNISVFKAISISVKATKGNKLKLFTLILSFIPWFLFSILIIPLFYVIPYVGLSITLFARFAIEKYLLENPLPVLVHKAANISFDPYYDILPSDATCSPKPDEPNVDKYH